MINNPKLIKKVKKSIESANLEDYFEKMKTERVQGQLRVNNKQYCDWLEGFIKNLPNGYDEEDFAYRTIKKKKRFTGKDILNEKDLDHFYLFLNIVGDKQRVKEYYNFDLFEEKEYVFKYNNTFYRFNILIGQGSSSTIKVIDEPDFSYVDLDKYFKKENQELNKTVFTTSQAEQK